MILTPGQRLQSVVDDTNVIVVKASGADIDLRCGGHPMVLDDGSVVQSTKPSVDGGPTKVGKRYHDLEDTVEVVVLRAGTNVLSLREVPLEPKNPKPVPSAD